MIGTAIALALFTNVDIESQFINVSLDPVSHQARVTARLALVGEGPLRLRLTDLAEIESITLAAGDVEYERTAGQGGEPGRIDLAISRGGPLELIYRAEFSQDISAGERPGQIHNFSVDAHVGEDGVFLSEGAAWHPQPVGEDDYGILHRIEVAIEPIEGWVIVASGDPVDGGDVNKPCWRWRTPRDIEAVAIAGSRHVLHGKIHETIRGPVEIVVQLRLEHGDLAPMIADEAGRYLDIYVPLLGQFPYKRITVVENFFSSGFAFPGFTLIGSRVIAMGRHLLEPGLLDHEMIHNWWGNGVYVDRGDGNWCEALTSYCANYYRRIADGGEAAGRAYRRGTLMKLSSDPATLDDGPVGMFGSADPSSGGTHRFVGYDKGAFLFMMLSQSITGDSDMIDRSRTWAALRRFASENMGKRANWRDIQNAFEQEFGVDLEDFFQRWVRRHTVPVTPGADELDRLDDFLSLYPPGLELFTSSGEDEKGPWIEIDPDFWCYRVLPPEQIVPTGAGTFGTGGFQAITTEERGEVASYLQQIESDEQGENLLLIGEGAIAEHAEMIARTSDPITIGEGVFTVGGHTYIQPTLAVLHTMQHPDRPGRFITVFHSNGEEGWTRLRLIRFYSRDTTIVWDGRRVIERRIFEPDRKIHLKQDADRLQD